MEQGVFAHSTVMPEGQDVGQKSTDDAVLDAAATRLLTASVPMLSVSDAIAAHRAARERLNEACHSVDEVAVREGGGDTSEAAMAPANAVWQAANDREIRAFEDLLSCRPPDVAGLAEMLAYIAESPALGDLDDGTDALRNIAAAANSVAVRAPSVGDAEWLALEPILVPMLNDYDALWAATRPLHEAALSSIGSEEERCRLPSQELYERERRAFQATGYAKAYEAASAASREIEALIEARMQVPATTLNGFLLKARVALSLPQFQGCVESDLGSMVAVRFQLSANASFAHEFCPAIGIRNDGHGSSGISGLPLVEELLDAWGEWSTTCGTGEDTDSVAQWERNADLRDGLIDRAAALPPTRENVPAKAIAQSWLEYVSLWQRDKPRDDYGVDGRLCLDIHDAVSLTPAEEDRGSTGETKAHKVRYHGVVIADHSMAVLRNLYEVADTIGSLCSAIAEEGRCFDGKQLLPPGVFAQDIAAQAFFMMDACQGEAASRGAVSAEDRELRLIMLARAIIANGDNAETLAFVREVVSLVEDRT